MTSSGTKSPSIWESSSNPSKAPGTTSKSAISMSPGRLDGFVCKPRAPRAPSLSPPGRLGATNGLAGLPGSSITKGGGRSEPAGHPIALGLMGPLPPIPGGAIPGGGILPLLSSVSLRLSTIMQVTLSCLARSSRSHSCYPVRCSCWDRCACYYMPSSHVNTGAPTIVSWSSKDLLPASRNSD